MLTRLKRLIKQVGMIKISADLGYRSSSTISHWIKNKEIPSKAKQKVKEYLEANNA